MTQVPIDLQRLRALYSILTDERTQRGWRQSSSRYFASRVADHNKCRSLHAR